MKTQTETPVIEFAQVVERGCGMDVHKETVVATVAGVGIKQETRTFSTFTKALQELKEWLTSLGVTTVAMESTGVYWKPVFNVLEADFEILLVNARHVKNVPGHKTDKRDSRWLTKLLLSGLLQGSFIPPLEIRQLRDLFRYKRKLTGQVSAEKNRLQKILEDANVKLSSVVSDTFGVSATKIIDALLAGEENIEELVKLCHGKLKPKQAALEEALVGKLTEHHKFMLRTIKKSIGNIEGIIAEVGRQIEEQSKAYEVEIELLQTIPGVGKESAIGIIAEIGVEMEVFPNEQHLASWAGMSPGTNESAGKKKVRGRRTEISISKRCWWKPAGAHQERKTPI
jgi:transposase